MHTGQVGQAATTGVLTSGCVAQADTNTAAAALKIRIMARRGESKGPRGDSIMVWVVFEVLLAFGLAVFIVWWTFPKDKSDDKSEDAGKDQ